MSMDFRWISGGISILVLVVFVACGIAFGWNKSDWAAWVQAIGSVGAILAAAGFVQWQHHLELARRRSDDVLARKRRLAVIVELAKANVYNLGFVCMQFGSPVAFAEIGRLQSDFDLSYVDDLGNNTGAIPLHDLDDGNVVSYVLLSTMHARQARGIAQRMLREYQHADTAMYDSAVEALKRELDGCKSSLASLIKCAEALDK